MTTDKTNRKYDRSRSWWISGTVPDVFWKTGHDVISCGLALVLKRRKEWLMHGLGRRFGG